MLHLLPSSDLVLLHSGVVFEVIFTAAFAKATFSAQGPPEKWNTLIPVKIRPSEQRVAHPTV
jgi:hypothetical protein